jgi:hypothetical protein
VQFSKGRMSRPTQQMNKCTQGHCCSLPGPQARLLPCRAHAPSPPLSKTPPAMRGDCCLLRFLWPAAAATLAAPSPSVPACTPCALLDCAACGRGAVPAATPLQRRRSGCAARVAAAASANALMPPLEARPR